MEDYWMSGGMELTEYGRKHLEMAIRHHFRQLNALGIVAAMNAVAAIGMCKEFQSESCVGRAYICTSIQKGLQPVFKLFFSNENAKSCRAEAKQVNRIRELRKKAGLTQDDLAKAAGISRPFLSTIETGAAVPTVSKAADIAAVLKTTVDELFQKSD